MHIAESTYDTGGEVIEQGEIVQDTNLVVGWKERKNDADFRRAERYALMGGKEHVSAGDLFLIDKLRLELILLFKEEIKDFTTAELIKLNYIQSRPQSFTDFISCIEGNRMSKTAKIGYIYQLVSTTEIPETFTVPGYTEVLSGEGAQIISINPKITLADEPKTITLPETLSSIRVLSTEEIQVLFGDMLPYVQSTLTRLSGEEIETLSHRCHGIRPLVSHLLPDTLYDIATIELERFVNFCERDNIALAKEFDTTTGIYKKTQIDAEPTVVGTTTKKFSTAALSILTLENLLSHIGVGRIDMFGEENLRTLGATAPQKLVLLGSIPKENLALHSTEDMLGFSEEELLALVQYKRPNLSKGRFTTRFSKLGIDVHQESRNSLEKAKTLTPGDISDFISSSCIQILRTLKTSNIVYDASIHSVPQVARVSHTLSEEKVSALTRISKEVIDALGGYNELGTLSLENLKIIGITPETNLRKIGKEIYSCTRQELIALAELPARVTRAFIAEGDLKAYIEYKALKPVEMNHALWKILKYAFSLKDVRKVELDAVLYMLRNAQNVHITAMLFDDVGEGRLIQLYNRFARNETLIKIMNFFGETVRSELLTKGGNVRLLKARA